MNIQKPPRRLILIDNLVPSLSLHEEERNIRVCVINLQYIHRFAKALHRLSKFIKTNFTHDKQSAKN